LVLTGQEFLAALRRTGRRNGVPVAVDNKKGKGSHVTVYYGNRSTTLKDRKKEIPRPLLKTMLRHLGLREEDLA
jgi:mRNA interferase HicA